ncbi:MAG: putative ABC transporter ATP-binding protein YxlF [Candidatus Aerophobetes bacterium ADurb.Bin490]|nr:MAG: putative ABC transporter ATP-binding protein YxlF [Candidatus Aerophobetes bacterium ADurb.Bin490]HNZ29357.1 ABC transporter ATP-binding protein [Candidatus Goldiibacteriota bacterium]HPI03985.1 ABC transporter ATP-binding protein [Candidatus Goldiibacteriota bacterium]HRQ43873.1 ABC transporter ATP-binding protein [Candidatus Goldiibacteriota bacterium]
MNVIEVKGLTKIYKAQDFWKNDRVTAVRDVTFSVQKGEVFGLLGLNGAGKTTLMKVLLGLLKPTNGSVLILGGDIEDRAVRGRIGYLSELPYFPKYLKAREVLSYFADIFGIDEKIKKHKIEEVLKITGLDVRSDVRIKGFSKGMQGRLGLAQALLNDPELLLLDEPMSGLDPLGYKETREIILGLKKAGKTIFFNSHILSEVEKICDKVGVLHKGTMSEIKTVADIVKEHGDVEKYFVKIAGEN